MATITIKQAIRYIDDTHAQVTKAFEKKACVFGTEEFYQWREYKAIFPNAMMINKSIKKNPNQKTRRNMTYDNMKEYINTLAEEEVKKAVLAEFDTIQKRAKIQKSPYQYVLSWFEAKFEGFNDLEQFMNQKEAERKAKEDAEKASSSTTDSND